MQKITLILIAAITLSACKNNQNKFDATGTFEADEVIVSAQQSGQILSLNIHEGDALHSPVGSLPGNRCGGHFTSIQAGRAGVQVSSFVGTALNLGSRERQ